VRTRLALPDQSLLVVLLETNPALWEAPVGPGGADAAGVRSLGYRAVVEQARRALAAGAPARRARAVAPASPLAAL
jgi:hypothetical protein